MTDISKARQALRNYARGGHEIDLSELSGWADHVPPHAKIAVLRGEAAGKAFMAVQNVLTLLEEQREGHKRWEGDPASDTALILIDDVEAAILKALS